MRAQLSTEYSATPQLPADSPRYMIQTESWSRDSDQIVGPSSLFRWKAMECEPSLKELKRGESTLCTYAYRDVRPLVVVRITRLF